MAKKLHPYSFRSNIVYFWKLQSIPCTIESLKFRELFILNSILKILNKYNMKILQYYINYYKYKVIVYIYYLYYLIKSEERIKKVYYFNKEYKRFLYIKKNKKHEFSR